MKERSKKSDEYKNIFGVGNRRSDGPSTIADWTTANAGKIVDLISAASVRGGAVRFGYTRDGGAYALGLYYSDSYATKYCRPSENIDDFLDEWAEFFRNIQDGPKVSQPGLFQ